MAAGTADFVMQPQLDQATGGIAFPRPGLGSETADISFLATNSYFKTLLTSVALTGSSNSGTPHTLTIATGVYTDNVLYLRNNSGGYCAIAGLDDDGVETFAVGFADPTTHITLRDRVYIEAGNQLAANNGDVRKFEIHQYALNVGTALALNRYPRLTLGTNGDLKIWQLVPGSAADNGTGEPTSPLALQIQGNGGKVGVIHAPASTSALFQVGNTVPPAIGVTWGSYFYQSGLNRIGVDGAAGQGIELLEAGVRKWLISNSGTVFSLYYTPGGFTALSVTNDGVITAPFGLETGTTVSFEGATANTSETRLAVTDPTADRTITIGDASGRMGVTATPLTVHAAGTVAALPAVSAILNFGTTDPTITINEAGTWILYSRATLKYTAATFAGNETATLKLRRTNNTAADVTNATTTQTLRIVTTLTDGFGAVDLAPVIYTTTNTTDIIELWGALSNLPAAGSMDATEASIVAVRIY